MTPSPGMMRMVVPLLSGEETPGKLRDFWSAMVTASVGIRRMAASPAAFIKPEETAPALVVWTSPMQDVAQETEEAEEWGGATRRVAEMLLPPPPPPRKSGVSLTVATGDLARVAIMSGVIRSTVCPLESVVMEDGGRRRTSLPWMRRLVAVMDTFKRKAQKIKTLCGYLRGKSPCLCDGYAGFTHVSTNGRQGL